MRPPRSAHDLQDEELMVLRPPQTLPHPNQSCSPLGTLLNPGHPRTPHPCGAVGSREPRAVRHGTEYH